MRQALSYFLLFLFLFGALVPGQTQEELTRLPELWRHYQVHKTQSADTTFLQYIQLHYGNDVAKHRAVHDHSKLPLKSGDNHLHLPGPVELPCPFEVALQPVLLGKNPVIFQDQIVPNTFLYDIWQPPRNG